MLVRGVSRSTCYVVNGTVCIKVNDTRFEAAAGSGHIYEFAKNGKQTWSNCHVYLVTIP